MTLLQHPTNTAAWPCPEGHVSLPTLIQRSGITYRQADYWCRTGLLVAAPRGPGATSGDTRYYPIAELNKACVVAWLLDAGLSLQTIRSVIDDLLETGHAHLTPGLVIHLPEQL